ALLLGRGDGAAGPEVRFVPLGAARPVDEAVAAWRAQVQAGRVDEAADRALRERVWEPLARALPGRPGAPVRPLLFAPHAALALVPFEAVRLADGRYLIEQYQIRYVSGGRDLMPRPRPRELPDRAVVLAAPAYDAGGEPSPGLGPRPPAAATPDPPALRFRPLPGFDREADAVARLLRERGDWAVRELRAAGAS